MAGQDQLDLFGAAPAPAPTPRARRAAARALELGPESWENHELRAQIALRTGDRKTAVAALTQAGALARDEPDRARLAELLRRVSG